MVVKSKSKFPSVLSRLEPTKVKKTTSFEVVSGGKFGKPIFYFLGVLFIINAKFRMDQWI